MTQRAMPSELEASENIQPMQKGHCGGSFAAGDVFIVEFLEEDGYTAAIADVSSSQMRPATSDDLANDRFRKRSPV